MDNKQEGPSQWVVPEHKVTSCAGCKWLKTNLKPHHLKINTSHICMFEDDGSSMGRPLSFNMINNSIIPGEWCPFPANEV